MKKPVVIGICLLLAVVFTFLIQLSANKKYAQATRAVDGYRAAEFIAAGQEIKPEDVEKVKVPESVAGVDTGEVAGKTAAVSMVKGQYIYQDALTETKGIRQGYVGVYIPTDLSSSAGALAGDTVDVCAVVKTGPIAEGYVIIENARVLASVDSSGSLITPARTSGVGELAGASKVAAAVQIEVPREREAQVVQLASQKALYLVKK